MYYLRTISILFTLIFFLLINSVLCQANLIPNPSFEDLIECPTQSGMIENAMFWNADSVTPDLFTYCATDPTIVPPDVFSYSAIPFHGNTMAGLGSFSNLGTIYEEISIELISNLEHGKVYYFSFMHKIPESLDSIFYCTSKNLNICFTQNSITNYCEELVFKYEDVLNENLLTQEWLKRESLISGKGQYIMKIGNYFNREESISLSNCVSASVASGRAYNFIDDFKLFELVDLPDTLLICNIIEPEIIEIDRIDDESYFLNGEEISGHIFLSDLGLNIVEIRFRDFSYYDTVLIVLESEYIDNIENDIFFCEDQNPVLGDYLQPYLFDSISLNGDSLSHNLEVGINYIDYFSRCTSGTIQIEFTRSECDCNVYIPNVFSPNGDGINDRFVPMVSCENAQIVNSSLEVFDRWGGKVYFKSNDGIVDWDGFDNRGNIIGRNVYIYIFSYLTIGQDGSRQEKIISGDILLVQ